MSSWSLLGAFKAAWPLHRLAHILPLVLAVLAVTGVVLGALYMLRFALGFLYGAAKAPHQPLTRPERARDAPSSASSSWRSSRSACSPNERDAQDRSSAAKAYQAAGDHSRAGDPDGEDAAMNSHERFADLTAMLPEHLLLLGIVLLLGLEIAGRWIARRAGWLAVGVVAAAAGAAAMHADARIQRRAVPRTVLGRRRPRCWPRRSCWRSRCRCC